MEKIRGKIIEGLRLLGKRASLLSAVFAAMVGLAVFLDAQKVFSSRPALTDPRYLIAVRDLPAGYKPLMADLSFVAAADLPPSSHDGLTDQDLGFVQNAILHLPVGQSEVLRRSHFSAEHGRFQVPEGTRAYAIASAFGFGLKRGDSVDLILKPAATNETPFVLLEAVRVLEAQTQRGPEVRQVVLALAPDDIPLVEEAAKRGVFKLALRNHDERRTGKTRREFKKSSKPSSIEIISE